ncbi:MAG TPA: hypothetical protein VFF36_11360, partial [Planctomycetota bacterium]|nr:hypothetical protein [Planctomycetota bacterium]
MAKKQSAGEASAEAAKKRRPQKKTAAPKAGARKAPRVIDPSPVVRPGRPERSGKPAKKPKKPPAQGELPIHPRGEAGEVDFVEDAEVMAESPAEPPVELVAVVSEAASGLADSSTEEVIEVDDQPPTLSPEEQELSALYGDDLVKPAIVHGEYSDRQTADEDRPMMPEINARDERKQQWQERRDRRRQRRDERDRARHERREHQQSQAHRHEARGGEARASWRCAW